MEAILYELRWRAGDFKGRRLVSIYFGGGTPSYWPATFLKRVVAEVVQTFEPKAALEITLEANPIDCTAQNLAAWQSAGINRLSIGVQSFDADELVLLGRDHAMGDGKQALERVLDAGWTQLSADIIVGVPVGARGLSTVAALAELGIPHLSIYELTIEDKTPLAARVRRGEVTPLDNDAMAELYETVHQTLAERGYEHYEISSYARPGHRARHNSLYWSGGEYLGLGNSAASFVRTETGARRQDNPRSVKAYLAGVAPTITNIAHAEVKADAIWLGLRTTDGVPKDAFAGRENDLSWVLGTGLGEAQGDRIRPTLKGFLHANQFMRRFGDSPAG